jgi:tetratricopeptide (TPR) repeat protein
MVLLMGACAAMSVSGDDAVTLTIETEGSYTLVAGDSIQLARELAVFYAVRKAAEKAADQFMQQGLIQFVDRDKNELVNLVADSLGTELVEDQYIEKGDTVTYRVQTRTVVMLSDFIEAQLVSLRLGAQEDKEDYRHEMEPQVQVPLRPGLALARAYRLLRKQELRMAIIYLDRLADAYPNWWEIYDLKAIAFRLSNQPDRMLEALRKACALGSPTACAESI